MTRLLVHRSSAAALIALAFLFAVPAETQGQQPFIHGNDIRFSIRTDRKAYNIGDQVVIYYTIKKCKQQCAVRSCNTVGY